MKNRKILVFVLFMLLTQMMFGQNAPIGDGTLISNPLTPLNSYDAANGTQYANWTIGGLHNVTRYSQMDSIYKVITNRHQSIEGTICYVSDSSKYYSYNGVYWQAINTEIVEEIESTESSIYSNYKKIHVIRDSEYLAVRKELNAEYDIVYLMNVSEGTNGIFNFKFTYKIPVSTANSITAYKTGTLIHSDTDVPGPISCNNLTGVGGNHSLEIAYVIDAGHDKTDDDLGSSWNNGTYTYSLVEIAGDTLVLLSDIDYLSGYWKRNRFASGTLTHVSGATHTSDITTDSYGLKSGYKMVNSLTHTVKADGYNIDTTFNGECHILEVLENYTLTNPKSWVISSPVDFTVGDDWIKRKSVFKFTNTNVDYWQENTFLDTINLLPWKIFNSNRLNKGSYSEILDYIPDAKDFTLNGKDYTFSTIDTITTISDEILMDTSRVDYVMDRNIEFLNDGVQNDLGFALGFDYTYKYGSDTIRHNETTNDYQWSFITTGKQYPILNSEVIYPYTQITYNMYRKYFDPKIHNKAISVYYIKNRDIDYLFVDYATAVTDTILLENQYLNRAVNVVKSKNCTVTNLSGGKIKLVTTSQGYAIIKFGPAIYTPSYWIEETDTITTVVNVKMPSANIDSVHIFSNKNSYYFTKKPELYSMSEDRNIVIGTYSGNSAIGTNNMYIGNFNATNNTKDNNIFLGAYAGQNNTGSSNVFIGVKTSYSTGGASYSTGVGAFSLQSQTSGSFNTAIGFQTAFKTSSGTMNTAIGTSALKANTTGKYNTAIGYRAMGGVNTAGDGNTILGFLAGDSVTGNYNVIIGANAGKYITGDSLLVIENTSYNLPLITGNFSVDTLTFNADVKIAKSLIINDTVIFEKKIHLLPQAAPSTPQEGDIYSNSTDHHLYFYDGTAWKQIDN